MFGIHANTGEASWITPVATHRGAEHPTFGLEDLGFNEPYVSHGSVEAMAAAYADIIKKARPMGLLASPGTELVG